MFYVFFLLFNLKPVSSIPVNVSSTESLYFIQKDTFSLSVEPGKFSGIIDWQTGFRIYLQPDSVINRIERDFSNYDNTDTAETEKFRQCKDRIRSSYMLQGKLRLKKNEISVLAKYISFGSVIKLIADFCAEGWVQIEDIKKKQYIDKVIFFAYKKRYRHAISFLTLEGKNILPGESSQNNF